MRPGEADGRRGGAGGRLRIVAISALAAIGGFLFGFGTAAIRLLSAISHTDRNA